MSTGEARRTQSATTFFNKKTRIGEETDARNTKRKRDEPNPVFLIEQASTSTLINSSETNLINTTQIPTNNLLLSATDNSNISQSINKEGVALKLNRLREKQARYESHKEFLSRCISEKLVPTGLKLELEPTIGNHDQEFLDTWFSKLNEFSLTLMSQIVSFCDKTIEKTNIDIRSTESTLKAATEQEEFQRLEKVIRNNEESTKRLLRQKKFKKYNSLKHKPQSSQKDTSNEQERERPNRSYANALTQGIRSRATSQENKQNNILKNHQHSTSRNTSANDLSNNEKTTLEKKIQFLNPTKGKNTRSKSPTRSYSKTNHTSNEQAKEIEELKKEIAQLKRNQNNSPVEETISNKQEPHPKNVKMASTSGGQEQTNTQKEVIKVMNFIQQTMATLQDYSEQLKLHLNIDTTQMGA